jgi:FkbM family methyltransferase
MISFDFKKFKNQINVFFDLGANIGEITDQFLKSCENKFIVQAFEANLYTYHYLASRFCNVNNVFVNNLIVSDEDGSDVFLIGSKELHTNSMIKSLSQDWNADQEKFREEMEIETVDICRFMREQYNFMTKGMEERKKEINVIVKMDIEGSEWKVLEKMISSKTLQIIDILLVEFHGPKKESKANDIVKRINSEFKTLVYRETGPGKYYLM